MKTQNVVTKLVLVASLIAQVGFGAPPTQHDGKADTGRQEESLDFRHQINVLKFLSRRTQAAKVGERVIAPEMFTKISKLAQKLQKLNSTFEECGDDFKEAGEMVEWLTKELITVVFSKEKVDFTRLTSRVEEAIRLMDTRIKIYNSEWDIKFASDLKEVYEALTGTEFALPKGNRPVLNGMLERVDTGILEECSVKVEAPVAPEAPATSIAPTTPTAPVVPAKPTAPVVAPPAAKPAARAFTQEELAKLLSSKGADENKDKLAALKIEEQIKRADELAQAIRDKERAADLAKLNAQLEAQRLDAFSRARVQANQSPEPQQIQQPLQNQQPQNNGNNAQQPIPPPPADQPPAPAAVNPYPYGFPQASQAPIIVTPGANMGAGSSSAFSDLNSKMIPIPPALDLATALQQVGRLMPGAFGPMPGVAGAGLPMYQQLQAATGNNGYGMLTAQTGTPYGGIYNGFGLASQMPVFRGAASSNVLGTPPLPRSLQ